MKEGIAGRIARLFIDSKITVLLAIIFMAVGVYASFLIPREEEPQIDVPMADIFVSLPGAGPEEVESRMIKPLEKAVANIFGVEHIYGTAMEGHGLVSVQFFVGEDIERSYVQLYNELMRHMDQKPEETPLPLLRTRSIDDVPILGLTLWSETYNDYDLANLARELTHEIRRVADVSVTEVKGGRSREIRIQPDPERLSAAGVDILSIAHQIEQNNQQLQSGKFNRGNEEILVKTGSFFQSAEDLESLIVGMNDGKPVYLRQVADVIDGPAIPDQYVSFGFGAASPKSVDYSGEYDAVTISVAKRKGADAMNIAEDIINRMDRWRHQIIPDDVHVEVTRNYGETASQKVSELLLHLFGAVIAVTLVVMLVMGWRGGLVVFISVPITFALTLLSYYVLDYTLNRITLFALVFVTGIVVDDSIIITENMHRHFKMKRLPFKQAALYAVNEVGNPTILATFTVIASVLPMAFVSGLMGPYMSPMPIGASLTMILSLFIALTVVPYFGYLLLRHQGAKPEEASRKPKPLRETKIYRVYARLQRPLLESPFKRWMFLGITILLLFGSIATFFTESVIVKMLPFDNKNEFQVILDMPEGTTLEETALVAREIGQYLSKRPEVVNYQTYSGTSAPINFNGLVRQYDLRQGSHVADIQVNITDKSERRLQSHDIAKLLRPGIQEVASSFGGNAKVVEVPPGPPVLSTIVAEVYGPGQENKRELARNVREILENTEDVVDVDWTVEAPQTRVNFEIDRERAQLYGLNPAQIAQTMALALGNGSVGHIYDPPSTDRTGIVLALDDRDKTGVEDLLRLTVRSGSGESIPIGEVVEVKEGLKPQTIHRKNQNRVVYVMADMAGVLESPVYAILGMSSKLMDIPLPAGYSLTESYVQPPVDSDDFTVKWDGEWQITLEVFRDLGIAFMGVLVLIYMLIVGWFQRFRVPVVMMVAIPLSLIGIVIGHWMLGAFFTATSFIGMIALAGIMVRNSVLLIDFINMRREEGMPLKEAVLEAGAVRATPILLTAGTVVIGAVVILFDPIFQGLAISLMGGTIASTFLTLLVAPLVYYLIERKGERIANEQIKQS